MMGDPPTYVNKCICWSPPPYGNIWRPPPCNKLGDKVKGALTEVKMSRMSERSEEEQHKKTYKCTDKVTVLGLVCAKMTNLVMLSRQEDEDRLVRLEEANVASIVDNDAGEEQDKEDDEGTADERDIWKVSHVTEEDFETTEGEVQDLYSWRWQGGLRQFQKREKENDLT
jgi:hypothetical protein